MRGFLNWLTGWAAPHEPPRDERFDPAEPNYAKERARAYTQPRAYLGRIHRGNIERWLADNGEGDINITMVRRRGRPGETDLILTRAGDRATINVDDGTGLNMLSSLLHGAVAKLRKPIYQDAYKDVGGDMTEADMLQPSEEP